MESLEQMQVRHLKEQRDIQSQITGKKKNATKRTRKGVNDECQQLERRLQERHAQELATLLGDPSGESLELDSEPDSGPEPDVANPATKDTVHNLSQQLGSTSISPSQPSPQEPTGPKKKRNRQKERMARRAIEQEAAAIAAEEEAAHMVDHKKIEKTYMLNEFKTNSLVEQDIRPDGHCLFSAVADQLQQRGIPLNPDAGVSQPGALPYKVVRQVAAMFMETHSDDFAPFLEEPLDSHVAKIRDTAEWGGQPELLALARAYNVEISVVQEGRTELIEPSTDTNATSKKMERIWLAYYRHGYGLGEHYNSLRQAP